MSGEGFDAEAVPGGKGQFDVLAEGTLVYSKHETGRFPDDGEVMAVLRD